MNTLIGPEYLQANQQLRLLNQSLKTASQASFYRERNLPEELEALAQLESLPLTTKEDLRRGSPFGFLALPRRDIARYHESFGTTGDPVSVWLSREDWDEIAGLINQMGPGFTPEDLVLIRFPYAISAPAHMVERAALNKGASVLSASSRTPVSPYTRIITLLQKLEVSILGALPLEASLLLETARLMQVDVATAFPKLRAICLAGEYVSFFRQRMLERLWQVPITMFYGATELGHLATSCAYGNLHIFPDSFHYEVIDRHTGQAIPEGERGLLCVTTLTRRAMPLIRYLTGDVVHMFASDQCPCGCGLPIIKHCGREHHMLTAGRKQIYHSEIETDIFSLLECQPVRMWFVIRTEEGFRVRLDLPDQTVIPSITILEQELAERWEAPVTIELVPAGSLFPTANLTEIEPVKKPHYFADWRGNDVHPASLIDYLRS